MKHPPHIAELAPQLIARVRALCGALVGSSEKLSHGEPTFFVDKRSYVMMATNHHNDGYWAVWIPVPEGLQGEILGSDPVKYFFPPYVGKKGWVGIDLTEVSDSELRYHIETAWSLKKKAGVK